MFCSKCGSAASEGAAFCSSCGASLTASPKEAASDQVFEYEDFIIDIPTGRRYHFAAVYPGVHHSQQEAARRTCMWDDHKAIIIARINERGRDGWQLAGSEPLGPELLTVIRGEDRSSAWLIYGLGLGFLFGLGGLAFAVDSMILGAIGVGGFWIWAIGGGILAFIVHSRERGWVQVTGCRVTLRRARPH